MDGVFGSDSAELLTAVVVFGSVTAVQGIVLGPGDCLFDAGKVLVKQLFGLRAGVQSSAIDHSHGNLCDHEGAGGSGGVFSDGHRSSSCRLKSVFDRWR
jgi:hypothetical protein